MGRPRLHDAVTAAALLDEAERIVEAGGLDALTVRRVAAAAGTTTRAVYTAYGSKEALVIALGARGFDLLREELEALPETRDPTADLVEAGVVVFRRFATHFIVADDGIGILNGSHAAEEGEGVGLAGMRSRLSEVGGRLTILALSPGTAIIASVPAASQPHPERGNPPSWQQPPRAALA